MYTHIYVQEQVVRGVSLTLKLPNNPHVTWILYLGNDYETEEVWQDVSYPLRFFMFLNTCVYGLVL